jgi:hypothetical protein
LFYLPAGKFEEGRPSVQTE